MALGPAPGSSLKPRNRTNTYEEDLDKMTGYEGHRYEKIHIETHKSAQDSKLRKISI
jgi:hypothetical protein